MDKIHMLQLGEEDWNKTYIVPEQVRLTCCPDEYMEEAPDAPAEEADLVFIDRAVTDNEIRILHRKVKAHTLFVTETVELRGKLAELYGCKKGKRIAKGEIQNFLLKEAKYFFPKGYGEKYEPCNLTISHGFTGTVKWNGNYSVALKGDYGKEFCQIACWRNNIPLEPGQVIDLWLEYRKDSDVSVSLAVTQFAAGSLSELTEQQIFQETELEDVIHIEGGAAGSHLFVSLRAKGSGRLEIIALHDRYSRGDHGYFLPGGERYVTSEREEIFCYFDPGDKKPPLNVYFAGYKTQQSFEGYHMMRSMGCPFLLLSEPRLSGGGFYMGSQEYESLFTDCIRKYMKELGFLPHQVIFSGLSMGTYGAMYYGCDVKPHAVILGKPLASIGNVAGNEKHLRPGGFPTSLDVLWYHCGGTDESSIRTLNDRFWSRFDAADWGHTKFIVSYMIEDDYDPGSYEMLISHLQSEGVQVYGKGIHGRHNDNTPAVVSWFLSQYERVLREDFGRRIQR